EGACEAEEVIELYLRDEGSPLAPPNPILCGFRRIRLAAGQEETFEVAINPDAFTVVTDDGKRIPGSGVWTLFAGFGAPDACTEELTGRKAVSTRIS
ncbi:MAG: fibronectin type III-like domain-contianing protein, partial [Oscillospiraceae bacterium]|nr:fibronectin type III-like domain-contianing protein [Oscillospiraceae bacterium]